MASSNTISIILKAQDEASKVVAAAADKTKLAAKEISSGLGKVSDASKGAKSGLQEVADGATTAGTSSEEASPKTDRFGSTLGTLASRIRFVAETFVIYKIGQLVTDFASSSFAAAGQLEQTNMAFQSLTGNVQLANQVFGQLVQYANTTPFESKDIVQAAQTLMGFGTAGQQTVDIIKQLGDVVSVGGGNMQQLSLVTGQIFAQGKMRAQDMYQVINDGGAGLIKIMANNVGGMKNLTAEFDKGGVPAKQFFDAVTEATSKQGFAFGGAQKEADTFNGRLSTLKDATTQFGMALIGVKIDPKLGLQIQPGGLFDQMKGGIDGLTGMFTALGKTSGEVMPRLFDNIKNLSATIGRELGPAFGDLWKVISTQVFPMLGRLWHEVIAPLIPVIGVLLVGAIKLSVGLLTDFFQIVTPVVNFLITNKDFLLPIIGGFVGLKAAMILGAAFDAIKVGFATLQLVTIPSAIASFEAFSALIAMPMVMPAIAVGAAIAAIMLVYNAVQTVIGAINAMNAAADAKKNLQNITSSQDAHFLEIAKNPIKYGPQATKLANQYLHNEHYPGYALGTNFAPGGLTMVGENGPELVNLPTGSKVSTAKQTQQMMAQGGDTHINITGNITIQSPEAATAFWDRIDKTQRLSRLGMA